MIPFKPTEVFAINDDMEIQTIELEHGDKILVIDNFYQFPHKVREFCVNSPAPIWKHTEPNIPSRNSVEYWDCRHQWNFFDEPPFYTKLSEIIEQHFGVEINTDFARTSFVTNLFQWIIDQPSNSVGNIAHFDSINMMAANIYLNTEEEQNGGTAIYRFKDNGRNRVFGEDFDYLLKNKEKYAHLIETGQSYYDENWRDFWEIDRVLTMKFNRVVIYPGYFFHGAYHTDNAFRHYPRVTQTAFISTKSVPNEANYYRNNDE